MSKFMLIDHSLRSVGGHHFEYALHVLRAAERAGFEVWLATNRKFSDAHKLPDHWNIRPLYRGRTYTRFNHSTEIEQPLPPPSLWLSRLVKGWWHERRRMRRVAAFTRDTADLFREIALAPGDQVFLPTVSELDLLGLAQYLPNDARTRHVDWHLQFHLPIYLGCEPDYPSQDFKTARLRRVYQRAIQLAADHRLCFYTTTEHLAVQYNRLGIVPFHSLPYPVNSILQTGRGKLSSGRPGPLSVTSLGDARYEKGFQHLPALIERLARDYVNTDRVRFVVQSNFDFRLPATGKEIEVVDAAAKLAELPKRQITLLNQPIDSDGFCRQAMASDIGLLLYDRRRYGPRCSGVLVELLSAGVPVLVSAGCWMADQLVDATRDYHIGLRHNRRVVGTAHGEIGKQYPIPPGASDLLLFLVWPNELGASGGGYVRIETRLSSPEGRTLDSWTTVIGPSFPGRLSTALVRLPIQAATASVAWQDAYGRQPIEFRGAELCFLAADRRTDTPTPRGTVGLVAAEPEQAATLLADMIENYPHYRETAAQFAHRWSAWHNPDRVVSELLSHRRAIPLSVPSAAAPTPRPRSLAGGA